MRKYFFTILIVVFTVAGLTACTAKEQQDFSSPESSTTEVQAEASRTAEPEASRIAEPTAEPTPAPEVESDPTPAPEDLSHISSLPAPEIGSAAFVQEFMQNPIDAKYDEDMDYASSGADMIDACSTAMESWKKQIDSVYMQILNGENKEKAEEVKKAQEEWINNQNDQLRQIRENIDTEDAMAAVTAAENIMLYYRSRAIDLCAVLFELEGQIAFG